MAWYCISGCGCGCMGGGKWWLGIVAVDVWAVINGVVC